MWMKDSCECNYFQFSMEIKKKKKKSVLVAFNEQSATYLVWCWEVNLFSQLEASKKMYVALNEEHCLEVTLLNISIMTVIF